MWFILVIVASVAIYLGSLCLVCSVCVVVLGFCIGLDFVGLLTFVYVTFW